MKREDAVALIIDTFVKAHSGHESLPDSVAEKILQALEDAGMKPPQNGYDFEGHMEGDEYFCTSVPCYEWES